MLRMISLLVCLVLLTIGMGVTSGLAINRVLSLDGDGDYVEVEVVGSSSLDITNNLSVELWLQSDNDIEMVFIGRWNDSGAIPAGQWLLSSYHAWFADETQWARHYLGEHFQVNQWNHYAITFQDGVSKFYLNGNPISQCEHPFKTLTVGDFDYDNLVIGSFMNGLGGNPPNFQGFIDEVRIWNVARTQGQIQDAMNRTLTPDEIQSENLVVYWNFDDGTGNDLSQYENHGTLKGGARIVNTIYVSLEGSDTTGDGSAENPYRTIQKGIDESGRKDIVQVLPGVYEENIQLLSDLIVLGSGAEETTVTATSGNIVTIHDVHNVTLSGFTIDGQGNADSGIVCSGTTAWMEIKNNTIMNTTYGIYCIDSANPLIKNSVISKNVEAGIMLRDLAIATIDDNSVEGNNRHGIWLEGKSEIIASHNIIRYNQATGVSCSFDSTAQISYNCIMSNGGRGIECVHNANAVISNNLIDSNGKAGIECRENSSPIIKRNTISHNNWCGVLLLHSANPIIGASLIGANYIIDNECSVKNHTNNNINATFNYWGTTDESEIAAMMINEGEGSIVFKPFINTLDKIIGDASGDGTISAYDAALILQYTVGLIDQFPATSPIGQAAQKYVAGEITIAELDRILQSFGYPSVFKMLGYENQLLQNYPNPFNPETWIPFKLAQDTSITINIYDAKGQLLRAIALGNKLAGIYTTKDKAGYWDGKDSLGQSVASGVYFYTLQAGDFRATRRMVILK